MSTPKITRSRAMCLDCTDVIESRCVHEFVRCKCGHIFLDGGLEYVRYGYTCKERIVLMTEESE
jgi:hypothetical protein